MICKNCKQELVYLEDIEDDEPGWHHKDPANTPCLEEIYPGEFAGTIHPVEA